MYLYHYYESTGLPFANLSDLSVNEANDVLNKIKKISPILSTHKDTKNMLNTEETAKAYFAADLLKRRCYQKCSLLYDY